MPDLDLEEFLKYLQGPFGGAKDVGPATAIKRMIERYLEWFAQVEDTAVFSRSSINNYVDSLYGKISPKTLCNRLRAFQKVIEYFMHSIEKNADLYFKFHQVCFVTIMNACLECITDGARYD